MRTGVVGHGSALAICAGLNMQLQKSSTLGFYRQLIHRAQHCLSRHRQRMGMILRTQKLGFLLMVSPPPGAPGRTAAF